MSEIFNLTTGPVNVQAGYATQIWTAKDVSQYDLIDLEVEMVSYTGTPASSFAIGFYSGLQRESDEFYPMVAEVYLTNLNQYKTIVTLDASVLLTYLWWQPGSTGLTNCWISITGMARAMET